MALKVRVAQKLQKKTKNPQTSPKAKPCLVNMLKNKKIKK
jgi:hypothetical protein